MPSRVPGTEIVLMNVVEWIKQSCSRFAYEYLNDIVSDIMENTIICVIELNFYVFNYYFCK